LLSGNVTNDLISHGLDSGAKVSGQFGFDLDGMFAHRVEGSA
jgi:hypothetical protein